MSPEDKNRIDNMSHEEMCHLHRFAPIGHRYFCSGLEVSEYFMKRYKELGGMTPEISKKIGWDR
jgi:hypothetical protein